MRERIIFQEPVVVADGAGGTRLTGWKDLYACWAHIRPLSGSRQMENTQLRNTLGYEIEMRNQFTAFTPDSTMSVLWRGKRLKIQGGLYVVNYENIKFTAHG